MYKLRIAIFVVILVLCFSCTIWAVAIPLKVDTTSLAGKGQVVIDADISGIFPIECGSLQATLKSVSSNKIIEKKTVWASTKNSFMSLSMVDLPDGNYSVEVIVKDGDGREMGKSVAQTFTWKKSSSDLFASGSKVLNNLVVELLNVKTPSLKSSQQLAFKNPYEGWVFFSCKASVKNAGKVRIIIDSKSKPQEIIALDSENSNRAVEAMRYLSKGAHGIKVIDNGKSSEFSLVVRAIPELIFSQFNEHSNVTEYGPYDWYYLNKHIFRNVNTITTLERALKPPMASNDITQVYREYMNWWKDQGKKWIFCIGIPSAAGEESVAVERIQKYWSDYIGHLNTFCDGIIVDEFPGTSDEPNYLVWAKAVDKLYQEPKLKDKEFIAYTYGDPMPRGKTSKVFADSVMNHNGAIALEWYQPEAVEMAHMGLVVEVYSSVIKEWSSFRPDAARHLIANIGYASTAAWSQNTLPSVDFKVHMDLQMNMIANNPEFFNFYGIAWYSTSTSDEEYVRWGSRLFRHYGIEGKTNLLSDELGYKYFLKLIQNPDFDKGLDGWSISAAEDGTIGPKKIDNLGFVEGRALDPIPSLGAGVVWTKRSAKGPNSFSQEIKNLKPGQLYSVKMYTLDYQNLMNGISQWEKHPVSININGADMIESKCFQQVIMARHDYYPALLKLFPKFSTYNPIWLNLHQKVFMAKSATSKLSISDWISPNEPGGAIGQELVYNFIEVAPYFAGE